MILVTHPDKPLELTAKATPRRGVCLKAYAQEIENLYDEIERSSQTEQRPPEIWTAESVLEFVRGVVHHVMTSVQVGDDDDLFSNGCDRYVSFFVLLFYYFSELWTFSLQATWIRHAILHALRDSAKVSVHDVPHSLVYMNSTVRSLAEYVHGLATGRSQDLQDTESLIEQRINAMQSMVSKYRTSILSLKKSAVLTNGHDLSNGRHLSNGNYGGDVVVLTGSTGRLGCHLLAQLLANDSVRKVYALNRESSKSNDTAGVERQKKAFEQWGLDSELLSSAKLRLVPCRYGEKKLGLDDTTYDEASR
jgi:hypothetical protein